MRRYHLFEFLDQSWLPQSLRIAMTEYLSAAYRITPFPKLWAQRLTGVLSDMGNDRIVDLGSGSGGPMVAVKHELPQERRLVRVTLTDLYPPLRKPEVPDGIEYWPEPVHAACVPAELTGVRTMFAVFHHLRPSQAASVLYDAFRQRRAICVFEASSRTVASVLSSLLIPLLVLGLTPTVRPLKWNNLAFTYLIPIIPVLIFWDGLVSQMRTYSVSELNDMTRQFASADYRWQSGTTNFHGLRSPYLIGKPTASHH
jgi:hypothetical protein